MESCQSKDDKCGGKVEQIFSSEKEQKEQSAGEPWVDFAYWKMLKVMYEIYQINPNPASWSIDMSVHHVDVVRFNHI